MTVEAKTGERRAAGGRSGRRVRAARPARRAGSLENEAELLQTCRLRAVELLKRNLSKAGILAATPGERSAKRGYTAIFGRDAAICAIGMALSGDATLEREAVTGIHTLAAHQAPNGQIPKFVDASRRDADFWYLGCIDSTLWWLIAIAFLDEQRKPRGLRRRYASKIKLALQWLLAQEHQRFFLLQQNEASDWADIMPRSGFVLYTNALWYRVKQLYGVPNAKQTRDNFNGLFHPFSAGIAEYRRARLLNEYVLRKARYRDLFLSFVNFSFFGDEGDAFGNVLAVMYGLMDTPAAVRTLRALKTSGVAEPYPLRVTVRPIRKKSALWRPYMARHRQNAAWQYHNGGIWPMAGGFWVATLATYTRVNDARRALVQLARACELDNWGFTEWLHGKVLSQHGMRGQSWNAAGFLPLQQLQQEIRNVLMHHGRGGLTGTVISALVELGLAGYTPSADDEPNEDGGAAPEKRRPQPGSSPIRDSFLLVDTGNSISVNLRAKKAVHETARGWLDIDGGIYFDVRQHGAGSDSEK